MDKVQETSGSQCYIPSSELFRIQDIGLISIARIFCRFIVILTEVSDFETIEIRHKLLPCAVNTRNLYFKLGTI
jgi:hypothetical protein